MFMKVGEVAGRKNLRFAGLNREEAKGCWRLN